MTGSSFSVATTAFISLAICAIISYGVFYYFKQRLSLIEQSQMEQARIMQAIISRGLLPQHSAQQQQQHSMQQLNAEQQATQQCHKEITITQNSLIEVSSDEESETDSESESSDTESESGSGSGTESDKWSIGDEIHQSDEYHKEFNEMSERMRALSSSEKKQIHIDNSENIDNIETIDDIEIENIETNAEQKADATNTKKIISLKNPLTHESDNEESLSSSSSESESESEEKQEFELKIGYKSASSNKDASKAAVHLNYSNMSVPALRQLAKERGLGGDEADLQKLKKKDLVQLLQ